MQSVNPGHCLKPTHWRVFLWLVLVMLVPSVGAKEIIGATAVVTLEPDGLALLARVDTGARTTSIHAIDIELDRAGDPRGKAIAFTVTDRQGRTQRVQSHVATTIMVRTAEGSERRYAVPLSFAYRGRVKTVLVTLNDRSQMRHRLLLGRNWLRGDYIVDVERDDD